MARRNTRTTPEQRAARRELDAALIEAAAAHLDGDEAGDELAAFITGRPHLARLSIKNCALLFTQAAERGADVTNVRTFAGWLAEGRAVRKGSKAYKLTVPRQDDDAKADNSTDGDAPAEPSGDDAKPKRPRFYLKSGWFDISQTDEVTEGDTTDA